VYGNVTDNGPTRFTYDDASNMRCVNCGAADEVRYDYDAGNIRVKSTRAGAPTYHVYSANGTLMWEENAAGFTEFVYLHGKQVATRQKTN
jgi:hypothetical protein